MHAQRGECITQDQRGLEHPVEPGAFARIEVEVEIVGPIDIVAAGVPGIEVDAAEVDDPEQ